jgi:hypothetical protein
MQLDTVPPSADSPVLKHRNPSGQAAAVVHVRAAAPPANDTAASIATMPKADAAREWNCIGLPRLLSFAWSNPRLKQKRRQS